MAYVNLAYLSLCRCNNVASHANEEKQDSATESQSITPVPIVGSSTYLYLRFLGYIILKEFALQVIQVFFISPSS